MTVYQFISDKNNLTTIVKLIRNNIKIDPTLIQHIMLYDKYYELNGCKTERYNQLAKDYKLHPKTVQRIILKLNQNVKW